MSCPSWQWHRAGSRWSPVRTLPVAPLWCDLGFVPNSRGNKAAANLRPTNSAKETNCSIWRRTALGPFTIHSVVSLFRLPLLPLLSLVILRPRPRPLPLPSSSRSAADGRDAATADVRAFRWCSKTDCTSLCIAAGFRESTLLSLFLFLVLVGLLASLSSV